MNKIHNWISQNNCLKKCFLATGIKDYREYGKNFRVLYINNIRPDEYEGEAPIKYTDNSIKTSKYSILTFLPKNLFEQLLRVANMYFLINIIIQFATPDPPTSPYVSLIPLVFVMAVTAIKQGYEDILRHLSDREINNTKARVIRNGQYHEVKWRQIHCGDIVEVDADSQFPCDLLLLWTAHEDRTCHVTTANLDGETNLKVKKVHKMIPNFDSPLQLNKLKGVLQYETPNPRLYEFKGKIILNGAEYPLTNENILLRGSCLRLTTSICGVAVYTGKNTKVMINSKFKSLKSSCVEKRLNYFIYVFLIYLAVLTFLCFGLSFMYDGIYTSHWYLTGSEPTYFKDQRSLYNFIRLVIFMNLINYIIPLSLYVTVELQRFLVSKFMEWDIKMYDDKTDQPAKANTSDINEDLGQIEYLFSDKTGTLTQNEMVFKQFGVDGKLYEEMDGKVFKVGTQELADVKNKDILRLFEIMALCHTVQVDKTAKERFQASSPDEFCFIKFCEKIGVEYMGESKHATTNAVIRRVNFFGEIRDYELLHTLEFDSDRKCMSVIVKAIQTNQILLLSKGAETTVIANSISGPIQKCDEFIQTFAQCGWRTLTFAYKVIQPDQYQKYDRMLLDSYANLETRDTKLAEAMKQIESQFILLGVTGIEDKLQEDCAETLEKLRKAGIKIWVLTGDKKETAVNISNSCKHFSKEMIKLPLNDLKENDIEARLKNAHDRVHKRNEGETFGLIIDGISLVAVMDHYRELFLQTCLKCEAVLCCRMSPIQKAQVVKLVKKSKGKPLTAAVGDGANDVSMIQEAHVGIGIFGKEGRNAARASDFAIAKFKYLQRLLLVHGYLYYTRSSYLVQYFFYKNFAFAICQVYYAFFNAFSILSLYNSIVLTFFNITFTSAPILFFGLTEQKVRVDELEKNAYIYRSIRKNKYLKVVFFLKWHGLSIWHSLVAFFFPYTLFANTTSFSADGKLGGRVEFGGVVITLIILIVHIKLFIETNYYSPVLILSNGLSFISYVVLCLLLNAFIMPDTFTSLTDNQDLYWVYFDLLSHTSVWLIFFAAIAAAVIPDLIIKSVEIIVERNEVIKTKEAEKAYLNRNNKIKNYSAPSAHRSRNNKIHNSHDNKAYEKDPNDVKVISGSTDKIDEEVENKCESEIVTKL